MTKHLQVATVSILHQQLLVVVSLKTEQLVKCALHLHCRGNLSHQTASRLDEKDCGSFPLLRPQIQKPHFYHNHDMAA